MDARALIAASALSLFAACAARTVPPPVTTSGGPRASWTIRVGDEYGSERVVCRSEQAGMCTLPASTAAKPKSVVVLVYLYPIDGKTTYSGAFLADFIQSGARRHETKIDYTVGAGRQPSSVSSSGKLTAIPGTYEFRMALFAQDPSEHDPHQFQQIIPVRVIG